jgi:hypothetical protein
MSASTNVVTLPVTDNVVTDNVVSEPVSDTSGQKKVSLKGKPKAKAANAKTTKKSAKKAKTPKAHKLDDGMKLVIGDKAASGALSPKRVAIVKSGMLVGTWRKKIIENGLAPKADPECWALLGHLVRSGNLAIATTAKS